MAGIIPHDRQETSITVKHRSAEVSGEKVDLGS
jgi:hypothetical protein